MSGTGIASSSHIHPIYLVPSSPSTTQSSPPPIPSATCIPALPLPLPLPHTLSALPRPITSPYLASPNISYVPSPTTPIGTHELTPEIRNPAAATPVEGSRMQPAPETGMVRIERIQDLVKILDL